MAEIIQFLGKKPVVVESSASELSSDAGRLPVREFDEAIGFTQQWAKALKGCDARYEPLTDHSFLETVRSPVYRFLADSNDQNDHNRHGRIVCRER